MEREAGERSKGVLPVFTEPETYANLNRASERTSTLPTAPPLEERGYRKLATLMSEVGDVVIFRRFKKLNMLNLMRLQAELAALELSYQDACNRDDRSENPEEREFTQSFYELREFGNITPGSQLDLLNKISYTLEKYNNALLQVSQLLKLESPDKYDLDRLHEWLKDKHQGAMFLHKPEEETWGDLQDMGASSITLDQIALVEKESGFSRGIVTVLIYVYDKLWGKRRKKTNRVDVERNQTYYPESAIGAVAKVFTSVLASLLPGIVILVLYLIDSTIKRIGAMLCFTTAFAFILSYWTLAKTVEVFAATAAFAAVEVVFIGSAITNGTSG